MIYVCLIAALLAVIALFAFAIQKVRKEAALASSTARQRERLLVERLAKVEAALSEKAAISEARNLASMIDGVASVCHRLEARLTVIEDSGRDSQRGPTES